MKTLLHIQSVYEKYLSLESLLDLAYIEIHIISYLLFSQNTDLKVHWFRNTG